MKRSLLVCAAVGVCAEIVAQTLQQIGGATLATQTVEIGKRRGEGGYGDPVPNCQNYPVAPSLFGLNHRVAKIGLQQQARRVWMGFVSLANPVKEGRPNDATAAPNRGDQAEVEVPLILLGRDRQLFEALRVGRDFGRVKRVADLIEFAGTRRFGRGPAALGVDSARLNASLAALRCSGRPESARAKTASVIAVIGTPSSSADCAVHRPVPFCSASSRIISTRADLLEGSCQTRRLWRRRRLRVTPPMIWRS